MSKQHRIWGRFYAASEGEVVCKGCNRKPDLVANAFVSHAWLRCECSENPGAEVVVIRRCFTQKELESLTVGQWWSKHWKWLFRWMAAVLITILCLQGFMVSLGWMSDKASEDYVERVLKRK